MPMINDIIDACGLERDCTFIPINPRVGRNPQPVAPGLSNERTITILGRRCLLRGRGTMAAVLGLIEKWCIRPLSMDRDERPRLVAVLVDPSRGWHVDKEPVGLLWSPHLRADRTAIIRHSTLASRRCRTRACRDSCRRFVERTVPCSGICKHAFTCSSTPAKASMTHMLEWRD